MKNILKRIFYFDKPITPRLITLFFWLGVLSSFVSGLIFLLDGINYGSIGNVILGLIIILVGPPFTRFYCEVIMIALRSIRSLFRMMVGNRE